jgi:hypothetical protein
VALAQAARFIRWHGLPTPAADLVRFMLEQLARRGIDAPDQRTVEHWARVVCEIAREPIADGAG